MAELVDVVAVGNTLGEGVVWDPVAGRVWWTDIESACLFAYDPVTRVHETYTTPERLCSFARTAEPGRFLCAFESGFGFWSPATSSIDWLHRLDDHPGVRLNDGRTDRQGRFWCGGLQEKPRDGTPKGQLWSIDTDGVVRSHRKGIRISNSITASPDGCALYFTDTPSRRIQRYPLDPATGTLGAPSDFVVTEPGCYPDGSTVDADGFLWNAQWGAGKVVRYGPEGQVDGELPVPASQPTCASFGGSDLSLLFVTTARLELAAEQLATQANAGDLLVYRVGVCGLDDAPYGTR